ncbi:hypothetical protein N8214_10280 [Pseudomonadales bacterium]|nr:hypothetical protein [Gammaproteobacteria bacterium]MBT7537793.1 hypothetical protein [Gammaproteobacteria bacterium]MDC0939296.1 hypothetical protein [Pseudomonadales bacterium]MDC1019572.1 hypothetical protein [Pseudomonadales bacterium]MDC1479795.1 hypothetical protein [Pseudomonadales bacterium]
MNALFDFIEPFRHWDTIFNVIVDAESMCRSHWRDTTHMERKTPAPLGNDQML